MTKTIQSDSESKKPSYATKASSSNFHETSLDRQNQRPNSHSRHKDCQASKAGSVSTPANPDVDNRGQNPPKPERVVVPGVRRIWGTLKSASITAVSSTLNKLTTLGSQLTVKKKVKPGGKHWWFLVKGAEEVLKNLEEEWGGVSLQINWKLEPCTRPKNDSNVPNLSPAADATHTVTSKPPNQPSVDATNQSFLEQDQLLQQST